MSDARRLSSGMRPVLPAVRGNVITWAYAMTTTSWRQLGKKSCHGNDLLNIGPRGRMRKMTNPSNGERARELNSESIPDTALNAVESALQLLYEAQIRLGSVYPHEKITPVLVEWLDPHARGNEHGRAKKVEDALLITNRLDPSDIEELTSSLLPWAYSTPYRDTIMQLLGQMRFETTKKMVVPFIRERTEEVGADYPTYWESAIMLSHLGLYDELKTIASRALNNESDTIREIGERIVTELLP